MSSTPRTRPDADADDGSDAPPVPRRVDDGVPDEVMGVMQDTADGYSSDNEFDSTAVAAANDPDHGGDDGSGPAMLPAVLDMDAAAAVQPDAELPEREGPQLPDRPGRAKASIASQHWTSGNMMLVHLDLETGGDGVGIIRLNSCCRTHWA